MQRDNNYASIIQQRGKKQVALGVLWVIASLFTSIEIWAYGHSYLIYAATSIAFMVFTYGVFFVKILKKCEKIDFLFLIVILFNVIFALFNDGIKSMLMVNMSLLIMISLSEMNINYETFEKKIVWACLGVLVISLILVIGASSWNLNTLAILIFANGSVGFIWFKTADKLSQKWWAILYLVALSAILFFTQTRNTALVVILCFLLLLIPEKSLKKKLFFRILYLSAMATTIFAIPIMEFVFSNKKILSGLIDFTTKVSDKTYGMSSHLDILLYVQKRFQKLDWMEKLFGQGIKLQNCHNWFYQSLFFYGYFGTAVIYGTYIYLFETGYKLFVENENKLALSCCIVMIGHFLMQCAETYMYGLETVMIVAFLPGAIILNLKKRLRQESKEKLEQSLGKGKIKYEYY